MNGRSAQIAFRKKNGFDPCIFIGCKRTSKRYLQQCILRPPYETILCPSWPHQTTATPLGTRVTRLFGKANALFFDFLSVKWIVCHSYPRCHELLKPRGKSQNRIVGAPAGRRGAGSKPAARHETNSYATDPRRAVYSNNRHVALLHHKGR